MQLKAIPVPSISPAQQISSSHQRCKKISKNDASINRKYLIVLGSFVPAEGLISFLIVKNSEFVIGIHQQKIMFKIKVCFLLAFRFSFFLFKFSQKYAGKSLHRSQIIRQIEASISLAVFLTNVRESMFISDLHHQLTYISLFAVLFQGVNQEFSLYCSGPLSVDNFNRMGSIQVVSSSHGTHNYHGKGNFDSRFSN